MKSWFENSKVTSHHRGGLVALSLLLVALSTSDVAAAKGQSKASASASECKQCISQAASLFARGNNSEAQSMLRKYSARCNDPQLHLLLSTIALRTGNLSEAETEAKLAADADKTSVAAHLQYGIVLNAGQKYLQASKEFKAVTELQPSNYEAWSALADLYKQLRQDEDAATCAAKAANLAPGTRNVRFATLVNLKKTGNFAKAKTELKRLLSMSEYGPEFAQDLAAEAMSLGAYDEAIEGADRVLASYPQSSAALKLKSLAYLIKGDAQQCWQAAQQMGAKSSDGLALQGLGLCKLGRLDEANKRLKESLSLQPSSGLAQLGQGWVYVLQGQYEQAEEWLDNCLQADQSNSAAFGLAHPLAHLVLSSSNRKQGKFADAIQEAKEAAADRRFQSAGLGLQSRALLAQQKSDSAQTASQLAQQAISIDSDNVEALLAKSLCDAAASNYSEANSLATRAAQRDPNYPDVYIVLAKIAAGGGNASSKKEWLSKALSITTKDPEALQIAEQ